MVGQKVTHTRYGCGTITDLSNTYLTIKFEDVEKKFVYPDAFEKYLTSTNVQPYPYALSQNWERACSGGYTPVTPPENRTAPVCSE